MISHKFSCIYIHIHKTAGTSIEKKLGHFDELKRGVQDHRIIKQIEPLSFKESIEELYKSSTQFDIINARRTIKKLVYPVVSKRQYAAYFKFTFIRNSWSRIHSIYRNVMRDELIRANMGISAPISLHDFIINYKYQWALKSQLDYITDRKGDIPIDFIGRFENLEADFSNVCAQIALDDAELPQLLVTNYKSYRDDYDSKTKDLIYKLYKPEIKKFEFEF